MRGDQAPQAPLFATMVLEDRIPADHPLRAVRAMVDPILRTLSPRFDALYSERGRPSIPPELLLRALLLQSLYPIRSERQLVEQLECNLLFRWFVGLDLDASASPATTFTKHRQRLLEGDVARAFLAEVVGLARRDRLLSSEHCTVDGTLLDAYASHQSVRRTDDDSDAPIDPDNTGVNFHGETRSNATHHAVSDPDTRLARKSSQPACLLADEATGLVEHRYASVVDGLVGHPSGHTAIEQRLVLLAGQPPRTGRPVGGDTGYNRREFIETSRELGFVPHVA
jgi:transposase